MVAILCIIFATYLSALTPLVFEACDQLVPVVFGIDQILGQYISMATATMYNVGVSLMILKFLKKGYEIYVMGTDGDPDMDPLQLVTNFIKAMVVAVGFKPIYDVFIDILQEIISSITTSFNIYEEATDFSGIGPVNGIMYIIALVIFMVLFIKSFMLGINMLLLNIGMPLACTGLLDNDKGVFRNYFMTYVKTFLTVLIQVVLMKLGLYLFVSTVGIGNIVSGNFDIVKAGLALACLFGALGTPKLLSEFLVPSGPGGNVMSKIYAVSTLRNVVRSFAK